MLNKVHEKQQGMEVIILEQLVPKNHLLRRIDESIDFSFIRKLCEPLYSSTTGRPAIEPEVLFRMLFVGYLYGIRSERRLEEEINYNMAYKWFCGLSLTEKAPDATTLSVNRKRRFRDNNIPEQIFNEILRQAIQKGLVGGEILYTDSTHVKAKANKHKKVTAVVSRTPKTYLEELDEAIEQDREALGKKPFDKKDDDDDSPTKEIQQSKSDPESGQLHKEGKPDGFHYSEHRTVDSKHNIVVNVRITPANVNDVDPVSDILDDVKKRLGYLPAYMGLDAGYHNTRTAHQIASKGIQMVVGYRRHTHKGEHFGKYRFLYAREQNAYICPQKHLLTWKTTNREGYREYWSDSKTCKECPYRSECFSLNATRRLVTRHVWQDALEQADAFTKTAAGKRIYKWRKETIELSFAEAKELHGLRFARMLGIRNMYEQSFLTAAVQNMKRIGIKAYAGIRNDDPDAVIGFPDGKLRLAVLIPTANSVLHRIFHQGLHRQHRQMKIHGFNIILHGQLGAKTHFFQRQIGFRMAEFIPEGHQFFFFQRIHIKAQVGGKFLNFLLRPLWITTAQIIDGTQHIVNKVGLHLAEKNRRLGIGQIPLLLRQL